MVIKCFGKCMNAMYCINLTGRIKSWQERIVTKAGKIISGRLFRFTDYRKVKESLLLR
jgi:hypothetical protein